jgi:hypothetical protein
VNGVNAPAETALFHVGARVSGVGDAHAVLVFDGVFLLRPQLNDAWDLRIFLEVDFQETLGCPTLDSTTSILGLRAQGVMLPQGLLRPSPFPMGLVPAVVSPRMS